MTLQLLLKLEKWLALFLAPCVGVWLFLAIFWSRFGPLAESRSGNPAGTAQK